jgi:23S rRNA (cytidine1920-2'-O)/16S rRNA (cytidine1409-2'-O)-methyltransferase
MVCVRPVRRRLDAELVRRNIFDSREQAQAAIEQHRVIVSGSVAEKPSRQVGPAEPIALTGEAPRFVSRGGEKLDGALERFLIPVDGLVVLDAGASTGGFTDCLLQRGASAVVAVDVGYGQLHERIRADSRVEVHERINLRTVDVEKTFSGRRFKLVVGDLSFISLRSLASNLCDLCDDGADLVLLVKPQFEAGREEVSRGRGVIRDPDTWRRTLLDVESAFRALNATMMDVMPSPITGADGNVEFLMWLRAAANILGVGVEVPPAIERAVRQATPESPPPPSGLR